MDAAEAIADLLELSSQVESVALLESDGTVAASSFSDEARGTALARRALDLVAAASALRGDRSGVERLDVRLAEGALVVVREGERLAAATTVPEAPAALVAYDLRNALRASAEPPPKPRRPRRTKTNTDA